MIMPQPFGIWLSATDCGGCNSMHVATGSRPCKTQVTPLVFEWEIPPHGELILFCKNWNSRIQTISSSVLDRRDVHSGTTFNGSQTMADIYPQISWTQNYWLSEVNFGGAFQPHSAVRSGSGISNCSNPTTSVRVAEVELISEFQTNIVQKITPCWTSVSLIFILAPQFRTSSSSWTKNAPNAACQSASVGRSSRSNTEAITSTQSSASAKWLKSHGWQLKFSWSQKLIISKKLEHAVCEQNLSAKCTFFSISWVGNLVFGRPLTFPRSLKLRKR